MNKQSMLLAMAFLLLTQAANADLKLTNDIVNQPVRVEVRDLDNPSVINRFFLNKGESKTVQVTGLKCSVKVFSKGADTLMVSGAFAPNQSLSIQTLGSKWILKRVSK